MKQPEILVAIGSVIAVAASATLPMAASAATNITGTVTLTDDADWTAHGKVTIASGATLDLDGHTLKVAGLDGEGTIASGEASAGNIIVEDGVADASSLTVSGSVSLTLSGSSVLSQDCDLRPFGTSLSVAEGATIDLNGHKLYANAAAFANNCTVTGGEIGHDADLTTTDALNVESDTDFYGGTTAANLFNNNYQRKTDSSNRIIVETLNLPLVVTYDFGEGNAQTVDAYRVWTGPASGSTKRTPSAWRFEGSNDKEIGRASCRERVYWPV